ncbi:Protein BREAST CANCER SUSCEPTIBILITY 1 like [Quillaja saponaria]|uniref:Protein BREAST CANCER SUSCEPTIBILITY 1 like n=1 Tax=Quillaja saponaria TaxID=32244 RepID=A0AAD7PW76_QUISA|nr:Protein BREAST CANCER SUSCEPTIBILITY 1 like [Quillaja saponaria]
MRILVTRIYFMYPINDTEDAFDSRKEGVKLSRKSPSCNRESTSEKKLKLSSDCNSKNKNVKEIQTSEKAEGNSDVSRVDDSSGDMQCSLMDKVALQKCKTHNKKFQCAFCHSSEESEASGKIMHYCEGRPVSADQSGGSKVIHAHRICTEWAPNVYFQDVVAVNLEVELTRSRRIKCCFCGVKGAALGCYEKSCRRSFHVPCARLTPQCRWDMDNFVMLCPLHASSKLPSETSGSHERRKKCTPKGRSCTKVKHIAGKHDIIMGQSWNAQVSSKKIVLCCSALNIPDMGIVSEFERLSKVTVLKKWDSSVTHVIASTDENGACRRTLKVLLGILEGKWIVNMEWIKACMKAMEPVHEEHYEINADIHGTKDGPRHGRLRILNKQPKLFDGFEFYFMGDFIPSVQGLYTRSCHCCWRDNFAQKASLRRYKIHVI